jgi:hypothetical protein
MEEVRGEGPQTTDGPQSEGEPQSGGGPQSEDALQSRTPSELRAMHTEACHAICAIATHLHLHSIVPQMHTYINVYLLWIACMQAISGAHNLAELDPKHEFINHFKQMPPRKLAVVSPALCFWISVKCTESSRAFRSHDVACMIAVVQIVRGDWNLFSYTSEEIVKSEYAVLQLLNFDVLRNQERIDAVEDVFEAYYGESYKEKEVQGQIVRIISRMFDEIVH